MKITKKSRESITFRCPNCKKEATYSLDAEPQRPNHGVDAEKNCVHCGKAKEAAQNTAA